jgi:hypothetical protein
MDSYDTDSQAGFDKEGFEVRAGSLYSESNY